MPRMPGKPRKASGYEARFYLIPTPLALSLCLFVRLDICVPARLAKKQTRVPATRRKSRTAFGLNFRATLSLVVMPLSDGRLFREAQSFRRDSFRG